MVDVKTSRSASETAQEEAFIKAVEKGLDVIVLVSGILTDGTAHHAYVSIPASKYRAFKAAQAKGAVDVREYGEVIADGAGLTPDAGTITRLEQQFGVSHQFENALLELVEEAMDDAVSQIENSAH